MLLALVALLSAVITPNGAVAALLPVAVVVALRIGSSPSRLLMPLAFASSAGALSALTGSPVNVLVSEAAAGNGGHGFGFFSFALVGVPLVLGTVTLSMLLGPRLVPKRRAQTITRDLSRHARALDDQYELDQEVLERHAVPSQLLTRESGVVEVVIPPRSELLGTEVFPGMVTESGDLIVLAVQRRGEDLDRTTRLGVGDALLLQGTWTALDENLTPEEVLVVDSPEQVRRQAVALGHGARRAVVMLIAMVIALASGAVPAFVATLGAAGVMVLLRVISVEQAYRSVSRTTVALIMIPIALSAAHQPSVSPRPVLMSVAVAAGASFLTPIATPVNLIVMGPGGYRFGDYWKLGACLIVLFLVVAVLPVPVWWSL